MKKEFLLLAYKLLQETYTSREISWCAAVVERAADGEEATLRSAAELLALEYQRDGKHYPNFDTLNPEWTIKMIREHIVVLSGRLFFR